MANSSHSRKTAAKLLLLGAGFSLLSACSRSEPENDSVADSVEAVITAIGGTGDEVANEVLTSQRAPRLDFLTQWLESPSAWASAVVCNTRAASQQCVVAPNPGVRQVTYSECGTGSLGFPKSGTVTLNYQTTACTFAAVGDFVRRTQEETTTGPRGGVLRITSAAHPDYAQDTIGDSASSPPREGEFVSQDSATTYQLGIYSVHKIVTKNGATLSDLSLHTGGGLGGGGAWPPLSVSGAIGRAGRIVNSGVSTVTVEVSHNISRYIASHNLTNVTWSTSECCYPTSGTDTIKLSGSVTGTAQATFSATCGQATVTQSGQANKDVQFRNCE